MSFADIFERAQHVVVPVQMPTPRALDFNTENRRVERGVTSRRALCRRQRREVRPELTCHTAAKIAAAAVVVVVVAAAAAAAVAAAEQTAGTSLNCLPPSCASLTLCL